MIKNLLTAAAVISIGLSMPINVSAQKKPAENTKVKPMSAEDRKVAMQEKKEMQKQTQDEQKELRKEQFATVQESAREREQAAKERRRETE
jgi:hypothetical protein